MRETLSTTRASEYFTHDGLRTLTGLPEPQWSFAVFKELLDNALDAINELSAKEIVLQRSDDRFELCDSGTGIPEDVLDGIFDFNQYISSKRDFRTPTRGFQGNALKTVIAICHLNGWKLSFLAGGKLISYHLNSVKLNAGIVEFTKSSGTSSATYQSGIIIDGFQLSGNTIADAVAIYYLSNPDVTFRLNDREWPAVISPVKRTEKTFIHWYDLAAFNQLLQRVADKDPQRTTREFCLKFSGTQRILSSLQFPHKRLRDFAGSEDAIAELYRELCEKVNKPNASILKSSITAKETFLHIYQDAEGQYKYKCISGEYQDNEATVPYIIEGFLLESDRLNTGARCVVAVNNSIPYEAVPFHFERSYYHDFCGQEIGAGNLQGLLDQSGFTKASGLMLYINFVSPHILFTDKAKSKIIADRFRIDLLKVTGYLCRDAIKEVRRAERAGRVFNRQRALCRKKDPYKKELMHKHFLEAFNHASGGYPTTCRQVFYSLREILNRQHAVELKMSDYSSFTQQIVTECLEQMPELENEILFERRGFFRDPFFNKELALGTYDVNKFIEQTYANKICTEAVTRYSIPLELQYNHVLFIEKAGFDVLFQQSGLISELNLGVLSTQGFSTRAARKLMSHFLKRGINVYVLHDCDVAGYLIHEKMVNGSATYKYSLNVTRIGLTVADVKRHRKEHHAEIVQQEKGYGDALNILSEEEKEFFIAGRYPDCYRRVEINALTTPELLDFVRSKIIYQPIKPTIEQLQKYISIDRDQLLKDALYSAFKDRVRRFGQMIDGDALSEKIHESINGGAHWTETMRGEIERFNQATIKKLADKILADIPEVKR